MKRPLGLGICLLLAVVAPIAPSAAAQDLEPSAPALTLPTTGPELASGSSGTEVALLQFKLLQRGFWLAEALGRFGESTRNAVVAFQKFYGLPRTGRVDAFTRLAIAGFSDRAVVRTPGGGHRIEVDLGRQVMIISTNDVVDGVYNISSGKPSTPTPRGSYRLTRQISGIRRSRLGVLYGPKYFTGGYAVHGSTSVPPTAASHGCVRVTNQTINHLWEANLLPLGTPITIA